MRQEKRMELTDFEVARSGERTERVRAIRRRMNAERVTAERRVEAKSMLLKISICTVALLLVIAAEIFLLSGADGDAVTVDSIEGSTAEDETLGKLKFVSLAETKSVFSVRQRWASPVAVTESALLEQDQLLSLTAAPGERVSLPAAGEVREIFTDETLGTGLRISHGNGLESVYYGLAGIRVEEGQPLLRADTLGTVPESGKISLALFQSGEKLCPTDIIDPGAGL